MEPIPAFPFKRCTQAEALLDFEELRRTSFAPLVRKGAWSSRSELDTDCVRELIIGKSNVGNRSSNFYHWAARMASDSLNCPSPIRGWYNRKLRQTIEASAYYAESHRSALAMRGYVSSQFRPSAAKALYEIFGARRIYDPCGGWGDRLSAALATPAVELYYCRDVNPTVFSGYALQQQELASHVISSFEYEGSEVSSPAASFFDFVFTSPPYWKVEKYNGNLQSFRLYKRFDEWMVGFLFPMVSHAWAATTHGGHVVINVSDCYANHTYNRICMPLIEYASSELDGCSFKGIIGYEITRRKKSSANAEPVLIFGKHNDRPLEEILPEPQQYDFFEDGQ